jgi:hypothetical protein
MIPVPMLALAVSPTDKQISKIVTLDYPTGQNSVAIITGLGELFLQGYNRYGECAVGETTAFYDHFAQITNINGSNNYQFLDVFVAGGAFVYNLDLPSGRRWMFTGSQAELLGDQSTAIASTPTELPAAYSKVTHTEHGEGSLREVRGTFGHNLWLYQFEDGFWGLYINGSNSSEIMLARVAEPQLLAVSQHKFPHFCVTDNSASYLTTDGVVHMLGNVQPILGVDTTTGPSYWIGYDVASLSSISSGVKILDYRLDANICTFIVGDDSNVLSHELAEGVVWFRLGSRNYYERGSNPPAVSRFFPGTGAHHVVDVNSGSIYGFANSNKSGYLAYNDSYKDAYVAYNGCLVAPQWGKDIAWIINTSTYANGHKDKEAKSFITFFVIDGKLYYSGSRVSSDGTNSAPEIFGKRCYAARSILIPDAAYRNLTANSISLEDISGEHATGETIQLQVALEPVGSTVYSVSLNTNATSDQLQFTQDDPNLFYIKGLKAGTYNIQLTGKTGSPSVAISSNTVTVTFSTGISGSVSYIGPVGEIPGGDIYNTAEYFKVDIDYSLGVTASDVTIQPVSSNPNVLNFLTDGSTFITSPTGGTVQVTMQAIKNSTGEVITLGTVTVSVTKTIIIISGVTACRNSFGDVYVDIANDMPGGEILYKVMDWSNSAVVDEGSTVDGWFMYDVSKQVELFDDSYRYYMGTGTRKPLYVSLSGDRGATWSSYTAYPEDKIDDSRTWSVIPVQGNKFLSQVMNTAKGNDYALTLRDNTVAGLGWGDKDRLQVILRDVSLTTELVKSAASNHVIDCSMFDSMNAAQFYARRASSQRGTITLDTSTYGTAQGGGDNYRSCLKVAGSGTETGWIGLVGLAGKFGGLTGYNTVEVEISGKGLKDLASLSLDFRTTDGTYVNAIYPESINGAAYNKVAAWKQKGKNVYNDIFRVSFCIHDIPNSVDLTAIDQLYLTFGINANITITRFTLLRRDPEFFLSEPNGAIVVPAIGTSENQVSIHGKEIVPLNGIGTTAKDSECDLTVTVTKQDAFFSFESDFGAVKGIEFDIWLPESLVIGGVLNHWESVHLYWKTDTQGFAEANVTYPEQTYLGEGWWHCKADTFANVSSSLNITGLRIDVPETLYEGTTEKSFKIGKVKLIMYTTCFGPAYHEMIDCCTALIDKGIGVMDPVLWYASNNAGYLPVRDPDNYETYAKQYANALEYFAEEISVAGAEDYQQIEDMRVNIIPLPRYYRHISASTTSSIIEPGGSTTDGGVTVEYWEGYGRVIVNDELEDLAIASAVIQIPTWPPQLVSGYNVPGWTPDTSLTQNAIAMMLMDLVNTISGTVGAKDSQRSDSDQIPAPDELYIYKDYAGNVVVEEVLIEDTTSKWEIINVNADNSATYNTNTVTSWPWTWYRDNQISVSGAEVTSVYFYMSSISDADGGAPSYHMRFTQPVSKIEPVAFLDWIGTGPTPLGGTFRVMADTTPDNNLGRIQVPSAGTDFARLNELPADPQKYQYFQATSVKPLMEVDCNLITTTGTVVDDWVFEYVCDEPVVNISVPSTAGKMPGDSVKATYTITGKNGYVADYKTPMMEETDRYSAVWSSDNPDVMSVNSRTGVITLSQFGTANIILEVTWKDISGLGQVSGYPQNPTYTGRISVTFAAG